MILKICEIVCTGFIIIRLHLQLKVTPLRNDVYFNRHHYLSQIKILNALNHARHEIRANNYSWFFLRNKAVPVEELQLAMSNAPGKEIISELF